MSEPYVGEIKMFAGNFAPPGYATCDGQLLAISQNDALFSLLGTIYGGDGETTFGLPDLRGRIPIHTGNGPGLTPRQIGSKGGSDTVQLNTNNLPPHTHSMAASASANADSKNPKQRVPGKAAEPLYGADSVNPVPMNAAAIGLTGGGHSHPNLQPFQCINFVIALVGVFPSEN